MMSVVFATKNGAHSLERMFEAFHALEIGEGDYEILAVDNGSTDETARVITAWSSRLPITLLSCPTPGKNAALNTALAQARGELIVFTDDDILPASDWLTSLRYLADEHPEVAVFGGRVIPEWPSPPPAWILEHVDLSVTFAAHPEEMEEGTSREWAIWGPNMMVRADVFRAGFRFNESIGPSAGQYIMGSETEFVRRVVAAGYRCYSSRRPVVRHMIEPQQFSREWILGRARRYGKGKCLEEATFNAEARHEPLLLGVPRRRLQTVLVEYAKALATGAAFDTAISFPHLWKMKFELGYLDQFRAMAGARRTSSAGAPGSPDPLLILEPGRLDQHYWRDLWQYRELLAILVWRDFTVRYKQTVLGVAWALLRPLLTMVVLSVVFGVLAKLPSGDVPYPILVFAGMLPWQFFANSLGESSNSLVTNSNLIQKVYFPRMIVPTASVITSFVEFLISAAILVCLMLWYQWVPTWRLLTLPVWILAVFALSLGVGLWLASLNARYRDFRHVVPFLVQFGLYVSPVGFSSGIIPERWQFLYVANPMVGVIEGFRWAIVGTPAPLPAAGFALSMLMGVFLIACGFRSFRRMEKSFADVI